MKEPLTDRSKDIFTSVVREYILTAEPVGSRKVAKKYNYSLSPATIRNVMADLEEIGILYQPHTSAGRIPTVKGFRLYVDAILGNPELPSQKKEAIKAKYRNASQGLSGILKATSKILSEFSHSTALVMAPKFMDTIFRHIEFILLRTGQILAIFVPYSGLVQNRVLEIDDKSITQDDLEKYSRYLNELLSGLTLREVRNTIAEEMKKEQNMYHTLLSKALQLGNSALDLSGEVELYVDGQANLFDYPEFAEVDKIKSLFRAFEEKSTLLYILDKALENQGIQIFIGSENEFQMMEDCSFILSPYSRNSNVLGTLGVVGPTRMNYPDIIPIVGFVATLLSNYLDEQ